MGGWGVLQQPFPKHVMVFLCFLFFIFIIIIIKIITNIIITIIIFIIIITRLPLLWLELVYSVKLDTIFDNRARHLRLANPGWPLASPCF